MWRFCMVAMTVVMAATSAHSQTKSLSADDLLRMLQNRAPNAAPSVTSPSPPAPAAAPLTADDLQRMQRNRLVVEEAEGKVQRSEAFRVEDRKKLADLSKDSSYRSVDLEIFFEYDSAAITGQAARALVPLGQALADSSLRGKTFLIAGHTDAKGSSDYNQRLSERRAQAIRDFLTSGFGIDPKKLIAVGYGKEEPKNRANPEAAENRRVQIVNLSQ